SSQAYPTRPQGSNHVSSLAGAQHGSDPALSRGSDPAFAGRGGTRPHGSDPAGPVLAMSAPRPETLEAQPTTGPAPGAKKGSVAGVFAGLGVAAILAAAIGWFVVLPRLSDASSSVATQPMGTSPPAVSETPPTAVVEPEPT